MKILKIEHTRCNSFFLYLEKPSNFIYKPGQFITITASINNQIVTRAFSIAGHPHEPALMLYIKKVSGGLMSNYLADKKPGEEVEVKGPFGVLTPEKIGTNMKNLVFIAAGSGISPIRPLAGWYARHAKFVRLTIVHQERYFYCLVFREELQQYGKYIPILSRERHPKAKFGHFDGYLNLIKIPSAKYIVIGKPSFVEKAQKLFPTKDLILENW